MFMLALRLDRWGVVGYGAIAFLVTMLQAAGFYKVAGHTVAERQAFGRSISALAAQSSAIVAPPIRPDTVGGYVQFRAFGVLAIMFAIWALASAIGAARRDEERGLVATLLSAGLSRPRLIAARVAAFSAGTLVVALAASAGMLVGVASGGEAFSSTAALQAAVALAALGACCYSVTLLLAQLTSIRSAAAVSAAVLLILFLVNSLSRTFDVLVRWRWISPFRYYEQSWPLVPGGALDVRATLVLAAAAVVAAALAAAAFSFRDIGSGLVPFPTSTRPIRLHESKGTIARIPVIRDLYERRATLIMWAAGVSLLGALFVVLTKTIVQPLLSIPTLAPYFSAFVNGAVYPSFLGFIWFGFAQLLMAGFAITQVARWTAEDSDGRLELTFGQPVSRTRVVIERAIVLALGALVIASVSGLAVGVAAHYQSVDLNRVHLIEATLLLVPFTLVFGAVGALLASRIPRATVGLLGAFALASYLIIQLGPIFNLPAWAEYLSAFKLYGQPLVSGLDQTGLMIMLIIVAISLAASAILMQRRDVGN